MPKALINVVLSLVVLGSAIAHAPAAYAENTSRARCTLSEYNQLAIGMRKHRVEKILDGRSYSNFGRTHIYCKIKAADQISIGVRYSKRHHVRDLYIIAPE